MEWVTVILVVEIFMMYKKQMIEKNKRRKIELRREFERHIRNQRRKRMTNRYRYMHNDTKVIIHLIHRLQLVQLLYISNKRSCWCMYRSR